MKRAFTCWAACVILAIDVMLVVPLTQTGCASFQSTTYKTLAATELTVDSALKAFADARVHGKINDTTYAKVDVAYQKYQVAFAAAVKAAQLNLSTATPADVTAAAMAVVNAVNFALGKGNTL